jgi:aminopeptidase N
MLAAGTYSVLKDQCDGVPLEYYVYPGREADGRASYAETPAIMRFFNSRIGVAYPWAKYAQVGIANFMYGGMENTSATTLMDEEAVLDRRTRVDQSAASLIAHEMAHQWWGDLLTCNDWRHLWLNESFASYFDPLYTEFSKGRDDFDVIMAGNQQTGINTDNTIGRKPVVSTGSLTQNLYPRGSAILHMLRFVLGDAMFWKSIHHYAVKHRFQSVETNDLKKAIEEATGRNLYWFFDEWLYKAGHPKFTVSYDYDQPTSSVRVRVKQEQTVDSLTSLFTMPVEIAVTTASESRSHTVLVQTQDSTYVLPCSSRPVMVEFDPNNWLLKELTFPRSNEELAYQALHAKKAISRINAIRRFFWQSDSSSTISALAAAALSDSNHSVRLEALKAISELPSSPDSLRDLQKRVFIRASSDADAKVREEAVRHLGRYHGQDVTSTIRAKLSDSSNAVIAAALYSLAFSDSAGSPATIAAYVHYPSNRNIVGNSALHALAHTDSAKAIDAAWSSLAPNVHPWGRHTALGILQRYSSIRNRLTARLVLALGETPSMFRGEAIRILGKYGDSTALPALGRIASDTSEQGSEEAGKAIRNIRTRIADADAEHKPESN